MSTAPRTTIFIGPTLRATRNQAQHANFSARLETITSRYFALMADLLPRSLTVEDWRAILPILQSTSFHQPGDAFLLPLRLKGTAGTLTFKLEPMKLPELLAIIEAGQAFLAEHPSLAEISDDQIRAGLKVRSA